MKLHLVDLCQDCSNNKPGTKNAPCTGAHLFYIDLHRKKRYNSSCLKPEDLIFGMKLNFVDFYQVSTGAKKNGAQMGAHLLHYRSGEGFRAIMALLYIIPSTFSPGQAEI